eukprot:CAMPEP_0177750120 /NCGR_PEP_ID=MMETSP0484_2-20121128/32855_1 /TAXON_ID=354590 /ORGANISM="Rhodomonas lens, Strain RHODO" /LENGTH=176 /DNA_ID=CAMNT_0019265159 /DNA_START=10 /DNA_END=537 /DNA_ORIENTATION=-
MATQRRRGGDGKEPEAEKPKVTKVEPKKEEAPAVEYERPSAVVRTEQMSVLSLVGVTAGVLLLVGCFILFVVGAASASTSPTELKSSRGLLRGTKIKSPKKGMARVAHWVEEDKGEVQEKDMRVTKPFSGEGSANPEAPHPMSQIDVLRHKAEEENDGNDENKEGDWEDKHEEEFE